jgi:hypothetical protein
MSKSEIQLSPSSRRSLERILRDSSQGREYADIVSIGIEHLRNVAIINGRVPGVGEARDAVAAVMADLGLIQVQERGPG